MTWAHIKRPAHPTPLVRRQARFLARGSNLEPEGFPLLGACVDYVANRYLAALEYGRRNHKITVFVAPSEGERFDTPRRTSRNGYNVLEWTSGDLNYRAVSDLDDQELQEFAALMQQSTGR